MIKFILTVARYVPYGVAFVTWCRKWLRSSKCVIIYLETGTAGKQGVRPVMLGKLIRNLLDESVGCIEVTDNLTGLRDLATKRAIGKQFRRIELILGPLNFHIDNRIPVIVGQDAPRDALDKPFATCVNNLLFDADGQKIGEVPVYLSETDVSIRYGYLSAAGKVVIQSILYQPQP